MSIFVLYILLGFFAELIDGCLGMAYGVFLTSCLSFTGLPFVNISAGIHCSEVFTTFASGLSHFKLGNFDKTIFKNLVIPGVIGGALGASCLKIFDGAALKPIISTYLLIIGIRIFIHAFIKRAETTENKPAYLRSLGFFGGYLDAIGGGGWGPIVTGSLIDKGNAPRTVIGTVNISEFFVTLVQSMTFIFLIGLAPWKLILGLILGGISAAPLAAVLCKKINPVPMMIIVACTIILINSYNIVKWIASI